jgi:DNA repair photolyase
MSKTHQYKGRGATLSPDNRYSATQRERFDDGWHPDELPEQVPTRLLVDTAKKIITYNQSPDVGFDRSINPYRGCEHGCVYCFARPTHAYLDLSPGLDFETQLFHKPDAPELLLQELAEENYRPAPVALGINTDAYQPVERQLGLTRRILEILVEHKHPLTVVTKSALIERDIDLLASAAQQHLAHVAVSITTLDRDLARSMEPRAAAPERRFETVKRLSAAGIPVTVLVAPLIPVLNDSELETLLSAARAAGAVDAGYVVLRLPYELDEMFVDWLQKFAPTKAEHVMSRIRDLRGGKNYESAFGKRMRGTGVFADLVVKRFKVAYRKLGFPGGPALRSDLFIKPNLDGQMELF